MQPGEQMKRAISKANLPHSAVNLFCRLADRADYKTGFIPDNFQPRSLSELARWGGQAPSTAQVNVSLLIEYGWLTVGKPVMLRRGLSSTYQVHIGRPRPKKRPRTDAQRMRDYRSRIRAKPAFELGERYEDPVRNEETCAEAVPEDGVTREPVRNGYREFVTSSQLRGDVAREAPRGEVVETEDDHELLTGALLTRDGDPFWWRAEVVGPCAGCRKPCIRYGEYGGPLCDGCAASRALPIL